MNRTPLPRLLTQIPALMKSSGLSPYLFVDNRAIIADLVWISPELPEAVNNVKFATVKIITTDPARPGLADEMHFFPKKAQTEYALNEFYVTELTELADFIYQAESHIKDLAEEAKEKGLNINPNFALASLLSVSGLTREQALLSSQNKFSGELRRMLLTNLDNIKKFEEVLYSELPPEWVASMVF